MGNLKKIGYNALLPMALGSWDRRTIHQARLIKVDKRSILSVTSILAIFLSQRAIPLPASHDPRSMRAAGLAGVVRIEPSPLLAS
jgi:hypothetical protein